MNIWINNNATARVQNSGKVIKLVEKLIHHQQTKRLGIDKTLEEMNNCMTLIETNCRDVNNAPAIDNCNVRAQMSAQERKRIKTGLMNRFIAKLKE